MQFAMHANTTTATGTHIKVHCDRYKKPSNTSRADVVWVGLPNCVAGQLQSNRYSSSKGCRCQFCVQFEWSNEKERVVTTGLFWHNHDGNGHNSLDPALAAAASVFRCNQSIPKELQPLHSELHAIGLHGQQLYHMMAKAALSKA